MIIRRALVVGLAVGALVLAGCKSDDSGGGDTGDGGSTTNAGSGAGSGFRVDVITHANEGDSFWDVV